MGWQWDIMAAVVAAHQGQQHKEGGWQVSMGGHWAACRGQAARTMRDGDVWIGARDMWEGAGTWEGAINSGGGSMYKVAPWQ